jgi:hypothetical protein
MWRLEERRTRMEHSFMRTEAWTWQRSVGFENFVIAIINAAFVKSYLWCSD